MTRRIDVVRSWVRSAAEGAGQGLRRVLPWHSFRRFLGDLRQRRVLVPASRIGAALAHTPGVRSLSVTPRDGRLWVDASYDTEGDLQIALAPVAVRFAPRGAKEVVFRVEPAQGPPDRRVAELVSSLAGVLAHDLYRPGLPGGEPPDPSGAIVEREGSDRLRVDLRTVPAVRSARDSAALSVLLEVFRVRGMRIDAVGLRVEIELPTMP
ncbi:MAG: hypothetical protein ACODAU_10315 [Myxococcota bacterium]